MSERQIRSYKDYAANQARIRDNLAKLKDGGATPAQVSEYIAAERAKSGNIADDVISTFYAGVSGLAKVGQFAVEGGKEIARNPISTAGAVLGGVGGAALGALGGPAGAVAGGAAGAAGGEALGESIQNAVFNRAPRSLDERLTSAAITAGTSALGPLAGKAFNKLAGTTAGATATAPAVEAAAEKLTSGADAQAFKNIFGKEANKLTLAAEQTALKTKPVGASEAKGVQLAEQGNQLFTPGKTTEAIKAIDKRKAILNEKIAGVAKPTDVAKEASDLAASAQKSLEELQKVQRKTNTVFSKASNKPTQLTGKELRDVLDDPEILGNIMSAGGSELVDRLKANLPTITANDPATGRAVRRSLTQREAASAILKMVDEFGSDQRLAGAFWGDVYENGLRPLIESKAKSDPFFKQIAQTFDNRFALFRASDPMGKKLYTGDTSFVYDALSNPQQWALAEKMWKDAGSKGSFADYAKRVILADSAEAGGAVSAARLTSAINKIDPNTVDQVLGKGYYNTLKDAETVLRSIKTAGVEDAVVAASRGKVAGKSTMEYAQEALAAKAVDPFLAGSSALSVGARSAAFGQSLFRGLIGQGNSFNDATVDALAREAISSKDFLATYPKYVAIAQGIGAPVVDSAIYAKQVEDLQQSQQQVEQAMQETIPVSPEEPFDPRAVLQEMDAQPPAEEQFDPRQILQELDTPQGAGGPQSVAPSMGPERNIDQMLGKSELASFMDAEAAKADARGAKAATTTKNELTNLIDTVVAQDDLYKLIRLQMEEDTSSMASKLSKRNEEGFRSRVYKDTEGKRTVGIGFNMDAPGARQIWDASGIKKSFDDVRDGKVSLTKSESEVLYIATTDAARPGARRLVKNYAKLGQYQQEALIDMAFQLGEKGAMGFARTRALIEAGKFKEAAQAMLSSLNAKQTPNRVKRRAYMLEHNVSLDDANAALIKSGQISAKDSIA